jgi:hypothetical protein
VGVPGAWPVRKLMLSEKSMKSTCRMSAERLGSKVELTRSAKPSTRWFTSASCRQLVMAGLWSRNDCQRLPAARGVERAEVKRVAAAKSAVKECILMVVQGWICAIGRRTWLKD